MASQSRRIRRRRVVAGPRSGLRRTVALAAAPVVVIGATVAGVVVAQNITPVVSSDTPYTFSGYGHGHGRGMAQWGAYGYASEQGWGAERILGYYYGGTTLGTIPDEPIAVRLQALDDSNPAVYSAAGARVAGRDVAPGQAVHLTALPSGGANVVVTEGCGGSVVWQGETDVPWVDPVDPGVDRPATEHLTVCGDDTSYRGSIGTVLDGDAPRTVNRVAMEDYLRAVVPAESLPAWADTGGAEALRAQAVAARSYAAAEARSDRWQTCDTTDCQVYRGSSAEDQRTDQAVASTAGTVLMRDGQVVRSEFSASSGGYTAGGTFPSVPDEGDRVAPNHTWAKTMTAGEIGNAFGVGELRSIEVLDRNGLGSDGGRALNVRVVGADRTIETTGQDARKILDLRSDWFTVAEGTEATHNEVDVSTDEAAAAAQTPGAEVAPAPFGTSVGDPIQAKYAELGGADGHLGIAIGPQLMFPNERGKFQIFSAGAIVWTPGLGAQVIDAGVLLEWLPGFGTGSAGNDPDASTAPTTGAAPAGRSEGAPADAAGVPAGATGASGAAAAPGDVAHGNPAQADPAQGEQAVAVG